MTFETTNVYGTQQDPPFAGRAVRAPNAAGQGHVDLDVPGGTFALGPATLFPSAHSRAVLDAALRGNRMVTYKLCEGGSPAAYTVVSVVISDPRPPDRTEPGLAGKSSWNVREAHFRPGSIAETPAYEIGFRLYEGGIIDILELDFGTFRVAARLASLEILPAPRC